MKAIVFYEGHARTIQDLMSDVSLDLFQHRLHEEVCEVLAGQKGFRGEDLRIYVNCLYLKSKFARQLTVLVWTLLHGGKNILRVESDVDLTELFQHFGISVPARFGAQKPALLSVAHAFSLLLKTLASYLYRSLDRGRPLRATSIRAWVEVTEKMYGDRFSTSSLLIYPFVFNPARQMRFVRRLRKHPSVILTAPPYSLRSAMVALWFSNWRDRAIVTAEAEANRKHAAELLRRGVKHLLTSDEFEVASLAMHGALGRAGVKVINTAHGVGCYSPYVEYSEFRVINEIQSSFYKRYNPVITFITRNSKNEHLSHLRNREAQSLAVTYLHQNFAESRMLYEDKIQLRFMKRAQEVCQALEIPFVVKTHPNLSASACARLSEQSGVPIVREFGDLPAERLVFLNVNSTAYFDVLDAGPVLTLQYGSLNPQCYYGPMVRTIALDDLRKELESLKVPSLWEEALRSQQRSQASATSGPEHVSA